MSSVQDILHTRCEPTRRRELNPILYNEVVQAQTKQTQRLVNSLDRYKQRSTDLLFHPMTLDPNFERKQLEEDPGKTFKRLLELDPEEKNGFDLKSKFFSVDSLDTIPNVINPPTGPRYLKSLLLPNRDKPISFDILTKCIESSDGAEPEELTPSMFLSKMKDQVNLLNKVLQERKYKIQKKISKVGSKELIDTLLNDEKDADYLGLYIFQEAKFEYWQEKLLFSKIVQSFLLNNELEGDYDREEHYFITAINEITKHFVLKKKDEPENNEAEAEGGNGKKFVSRKTRKQKRKH
jgi:hypothetical protein